VEVHVYDRIDEAGHYYFSVSTREQAERWNDGKRLVGFHHRNLRVEQIYRYAGMRDDPRFRQMLVNELLHGVRRMEHDQPLSSERGPSS